MLSVIDTAFRCNLEMFILNYGDIIALVIGVVIYWAIRRRKKSWKKQ